MHPGCIPSIQGVRQSSPSPSTTIDYLRAGSRQRNTDSAILPYLLISFYCTRGITGKHQGTTIDKETTGNPGVRGGGQGEQACNTSAG